MNVPDRVPDLTRVQIAAILGALLLVFTPVAYAVGTGLFTSGSTFKTDSGLSVQVQQDQELSGNPFTDSQTFDGDGGTIFATSSGDGYLEVASWGKTGDTVVQDVSVTETTAAVNPDESEELRISGDANEVRWNSIEADDSETDVSVDVASGDIVDLTLLGLEPGQDYQLVNQNGDRVSTGTANNDGEATFDVDVSGDLQLQSFENDLPEVSNLEPNGESVDDTITLAADIDDDTLPGENVSVTFRVEGDVVHETTITQSQRVNYTLTGDELPGAGDISWSVSAEDTFGGETTESASFVVPGNITVFNVSDTQETVPDATATVYTDEGTVDIEADQNGNISLQGLPANEELVIDISAPDYEERTTTIPSIVQAQDVYLIPNGTETVQNRFTLDDPTGEFDSDSVVYIERPVEVGNETEWRVVAGDNFGVEGATAILEQGQRYRIRIVSQTGAVAQMGKYTADIREEVPLRPQSPTVQLEGENLVAYNASVEGSDLRIEYLDPTGQTDVLTVSVVSQFNDSEYLLESQTYYGTNELVVSEPVGEDGLDDSYIVLLEGQRDGESFTARIPIGPDQIVLVPSGLSQVWIQIAGIGSLLLVGGVFSRLNAGVGAVATSLLGGIWWYIGLLSGVATWASVALAITFSVLYAMVTR